MTPGIAGESVLGRPILYGSQLDKTYQYYNKYGQVEGSYKLDRQGTTQYYKKWDSLKAP